MVKVYIAASFKRIKEANDLAARLREIGYIVDARWLNGNHQVHGVKKAKSVEGIIPEIPLLEGRLFAQDDIEDVLQSDILICLTDPPYSTLSRGGHHVELGFALGLKKRVIILGPRENAFHCLTSIEQVRTVEELIDLLSPQSN